MTNLDSIFKIRDITLPTKVHLVKAMVFPVVMYGYESWTVKKAEHQRIDAFELWCWRRLLRVPWTSLKSILKEISPGCSLEGLMLKLKLQYFGHLLHSICQQIRKTQQWPQDWKRSVCIPIPKKGNAKECSDYGIIAVISHASKVMLKILEARLQQYMNRELPMFKLVLEKAEEPEIILPTSSGSSKKQESSRKTSISTLLIMPKPSTVWITINCGKF